MMKMLLLKITPNWIKLIIIKVIRIIEFKKYSGKDVFCPICESYFRTFAPDRNKSRKEARCPNCDSLERHRLYWLYFKNKKLLFSQDEKKLKILHVAPEKVFFNKFRKMEHIDYYAGDINPKKYSIKMLKLDIKNIPFENDLFDIVICNHVLEHIDDDIKAMSEMQRVLKKDGLGFIQVPIDFNREKTFEDFSITTPKEKKKNFGHHDHVRIYGRDFIKRMNKVGFDIKIIDFISNLTSEEINYYGLRNEDIFFRSSVK